MAVRYFIKDTKTGISTIYSEFKRHKVRVVRSTGIKISAQYWNKKRGLPDAKTLEASRIQDKLIKAERALDDFCTVPRSKEEILEVFDRIFSFSGSSFVDHYKTFLAEVRERKGEGSFKKYRTILRNLERFSKDTGTPLLFDRINEQFGEDLRHWYHVENYSPNTSGRALGFVKTFMRWAYKRGLHASLGWQDLKKQTFDKEVTFLNKEDLITFTEAKLPPRLSGVRDIFCLGCFTGLRHSDLKRISPDHVGDDHLIIRTQKDDDHLKIPLSGHAKGILSKHIHQGRIPSISNQKGNKYLKEAAELSGLNRRVLVTGWDKGRRVELFKPLFEIISWHMARRTFITLSLEGGMEPSVIIKITGHSDIKSLAPYMALTDKLIKHQMDRAWGSFPLKAV